MVHASAFLGAIGVLVGTAVASPRALVERTGSTECNHDNLLRCFIDERYSSSASVFCEALTPYTTTVATVTPTGTTTSCVTVTVATHTDTISSTRTVYTTTIPSSTVTETHVATVVYRKEVPSPPVKRCNPVQADPPHCMTNGVTYPPSRITSACSCISAPASTVSVTLTADAHTAIITFTTSVTATVSTTAWATVSTATTSGVATVTVDPPSSAPTNLLPYPDFETGSTTGWILFTTNPADPDGFDSYADFIIAPSGSYSWVYTIRETEYSGNAFIQCYGFDLPEGTYTFTFNERNNLGLTSTLADSISAVVTAANGNTLLNDQANFGEALGNDWYKFSYSFTVTAANAGIGANVQVHVNRPYTGTVLWWFDNFFIGHSGGN